jgi:WD40 repeat protein
MSTPGVSRVRREMLTGLGQNVTYSKKRGFGIAHVWQMSWHPQYRSSKFRHVFGKPASKENCYDSVPITRSVHDNHFCAVNPHFIAVVTECAGGGAFLVIPLNQTGKLDPHYPKVCGHRGNVLDIKWNPFDDFQIASCSEDATIKIWDIPKQLLARNLTAYSKELVCHSRRVGLVEWHPTAANILFSAGYDYKVMIWNLDTKESVISSPVRTITCHQDVILSMSFNTNGSLLATACKDRKIRILDPRLGTVLQEASYKGHRANKVLFLGNMKKLRPQAHPAGTTGRWLCGTRKTSLYLSQRRTWTAPRACCFPSTTRTPTCSTWWERVMGTSVTMKWAPTSRI